MAAVATPMAGRSTPVANGEPAGDEPAGGEVGAGQGTPNVAG
ncbi:hypothetical protein [Streptomyces triticirhizae]|nr:hypothetical protein [Streptomyces triticirhizae]